MTTNALLPTLLLSTALPGCGFTLDVTPSAPMYASGTQASGSATLGAPKADLLVTIPAAAQASVGYAALLLANDGTLRVAAANDTDALSVTYSLRDVTPQSPSRDASAETQALELMLLVVVAHSYGQQVTLEQVVDFWVALPSSNGAVAVTGQLSAQAVGGDRRRH